MNISESQLQLFGLAMIFYVVVALGFTLFFEHFTREAKEELKSPLLTFGIAKKARSGEEILTGNPVAQNGVKTFLLLDTYAFVPLYLGFLLLMSYFLSHSSLQWAKYFALAVVFCAVVGAAADWTENFYSYKALESPISIKSADLIFWATYVKWIFIFTAVGISSLFFWRDGAWQIAAGLLLLSSAAGLAGLLFYEQLVNFSLITQMLIVLIVGILFQFHGCRTSFLQGG